jgi:hypothetical protein
MELVEGSWQLGFGFGVDLPQWCRSPSLAAPLSFLSLCGHAPGFPCAVPRQQTVIEGDRMAAPSLVLGAGNCPAQGF